MTSAPKTQETHRAPSLDDYAAIIGEAEIRELRTLARRLGGRRVKMVNSTAVGGGVAEILNRLVPLLNEVGVPTQWEVIRGGEAYFAVTKAFHNALHGFPFDGYPEWFDLFLRVNEENRMQINFDEDFVVIHDPQPVALVQARDGLTNNWMWRCHIDLSRPDPPVWDFLRPFVEKYDAGLFSSPSFTQDLPIPQYLLYPAMDPLSDKNRDLEPHFVQSVLERFGIDPKRPILTQISRFDRLKDPVGVIQAYKTVRKRSDCQLVLAGGGATDDPEGEAVLNKALEAVGKDPDIHVLNLPPWSHLEINALQRGSTIVIQKSLREGFGLTVTEALWKKKPVVASAVGGIPSQVIHKVTGMLTHSVEGAVYQIRFLLSNPDFARKLGQNGHEHVKENFLLTHNIKRYLLLFLVLLRQR
ncbi:MAG: glycosyltransferase [Acidobacteria bacterium]|nr:glycosyltransferase [Acidobacteriota bacterium]